MRLVLGTAILYFATSQAFAQGFDPSFYAQYGPSYSLLPPASAPAAPAAAPPAAPGVPAVAPPACGEEDPDCMNGR